MKTSKDPRHQARRLAVGASYSKEISPNSDYNDINPELIASLMDNLEVKDYDNKLFSIIVGNLSQHSAEYHEIIREHAKEWDVSKIYKMDLSILLCAVAEIRVSKTPIKVVIDEAVELAKEFGTEDSARFINGILGGVINNSKD